MGSRSSAAISESPSSCEREPSDAPLCHAPGTAGRRVLPTPNLLGFVHSPLAPSPSPRFPLFSSILLVSLTSFIFFLFHLFFHSTPTSHLIYSSPISLFFYASAFLFLLFYLPLFPPPLFISFSSLRVSFASLILIFSVVCFHFSLPVHPSLIYMFSHFTSFLLFVLPLLLFPYRLLPYSSLSSISCFLLTLFLSFSFPLLSSLL